MTPDNAKDEASLLRIEIAALKDQLNRLPTKRFVAMVTFGVATAFLALVIVAG